MHSSLDSIAHKPTLSKELTKPHIVGLFEGIRDSVATAATGLHGLWSMW